MHPPYICCRTETRCWALPIAHPRRLCTQRCCTLLQDHHCLSLLTAACTLKEAEKTLAAAIGAAQKRVHAVLLDNLNTRGALDVLGELIRDVNKYLAEHKAGPGGAQPGEAALCCCTSAWRQGCVQTILHCWRAAVGVSPLPADLAAQEQRDTEQKHPDVEGAMARHIRRQGIIYVQTSSCSYRTSSSAV